MTKPKTQYEEGGWPVLVETAIILLLIVLFSASHAYGQAGEPPREQMNRLLEGVHNRVNEVAKAATYMVDADAHLRQAEQMAAEGRQKEARAELELARQVIAADR